MDDDLDGFVLIQPSARIPVTLDIVHQGPGEFVPFYDEDDDVLAKLIERAGDLELADGTPLRTWLRGEE